MLKTIFISLFLITITMNVNAMDDSYKNQEDEVIIEQRQQYYNQNDPVMLNDRFKEAIKQTEVIIIKEMNDQEPDKELVDARNRNIIISVIITKKLPIETVQERSDAISLAIPYFFKVEEIALHNLDSEQYFIQEEDIISSDDTLGIDQPDDNLQENLQPKDDAH